MEGLWFPELPGDEMGKSISTWVVLNDFDLKTGGPLDAPGAQL